MACSESFAGRAGQDCPARPAACVYPAARASPSGRRKRLRGLWPTLVLITPASLCLPGVGAFMRGPRPALAYLRPGGMFLGGAEAFMRGPRPAPAFICPGGMFPGGAGGASRGRRPELAQIRPDGTRAGARKHSCGARAPRNYCKALEKFIWLLLSASVLMTPLPEPPPVICSDSPSADNLP